MLTSGGVYRRRARRRKVQAVPVLLAHHLLGKFNRGVSITQTETCIKFPHLDNPSRLVRRLSCLASPPRLSVGRLLMGFVFGIDLGMRVLSTISVDLSVHA